MNEYCEYLAHHGIRNQRWGVRNGPPYPLNKKAHKHVVSGKQDKELKRYAKKKEGITHLGDPYHRHYHQLEDFRGITRHYGYDKPENKAQNVHDTTTFHETDDNVANIADIIGRGGSAEAAWRTLDRPGHKATSEDLLKVNEHRRRMGYQADKDGFLDAGLYNNCAMCSAAMFLRGQGYEVQAGRTSSGCKNTADEYWFDGAKTYKTKGAQALYSQLQSFGNQGKGTLGIRHKNGSGHSVYFQMEKQADGKVRPVVYDGQIAKKYSSLADFLRQEGVDTSQFVRVTRLDGATPNWKHLAEDGAIRANLASLTGTSLDTGGEWFNRTLIKDDVAGKTWDNSHFRFHNNEFEENNRSNLDRVRFQGAEFWETDTGKRWRTTTVQEAEKQAEIDRLARIALKQKYGIT